MTEMNEEELNGRVSKLRNISEDGWAIMLEEGYVEDALRHDFDEEKIKYLIEKYDKYNVAFGKTRDRRQTPDQERSEVPVSLSGSEPERKVAFEEYAAKRAACDDGVRWFRGRVLGGRLLTAGQARELPRSPATRFLEANTFEFAGGDVPLVGHRAMLEGYEPNRVKDREVRHRATVSVDPPGITETVENTFYDPPRLAPKRDLGIRTGQTVRPSTTRLVRTVGAMVSLGARPGHDVRPHRSHPGRTGPEGGHICEVPQGALPCRNGHSGVHRRQDNHLGLSVGLLEDGEERLPNCADRVNGNERWQAA
jgi:hypothetical protein